MTEQEKKERQIYLAKREADKRFSKWRTRAIKRLPEISQRVFALRGKFYMGCGFHYDLEAQLGGCILDLQNMNKRYDMGMQCAIEVNFCFLFKSVVKIEKELKIK